MPLVSASGDSDAGLSSTLPDALGEQFELQHALRTKTTYGENRVAQEIYSGAGHPSRYGCDSLQTVTALPSGAKLIPAAQSHSTQRYLLRLHNLKHPTAGSALQELRGLVCVQFETAFQRGIDSQGLHKMLIVGGGNKSRPSGEPTAMTEKDDALLDRLRDMDSRRAAIKQDEKYNIF